MSYQEQHTDFELAELIKFGDEKAFKIVYERYWDKLFVVAAKRLGNNAEAEETVQDIFTNLWKRREKFTLRVGFDNYFAVAVKFEVINRRSKRLKTEEFQKLMAQQGLVYEESTTHTFDLEYLQQQLQNTINSLPQKCQLVFRLSRETDLTNNQIAAKLDISEKAVEKHITYALKYLRTRFNPLVLAILLSNHLF